MLKQWGGPVRPTQPHYIYLIISKGNINLKL